VKLHPNLQAEAKVLREAIVEYLATFPEGAEWDIAPEGEPERWIRLPAYTALVEELGYALDAPPWRISRALGRLEADGQVVRGYRSGRRGGVRYVTLVDQGAR